MAEKTAPASAVVRDVAEADFVRDVIEESKRRPVVVDFWAPWCAPCLALGPILERLVRERNGEAMLAKVNIDEAQGLAADFGIEAIPAVKAFRDGRPVLEFVGVLPEPQLKAFLDRLSPTQAERNADRAHSMEAADPAAAEQLYRAAVAEQPSNDQARLGLARVLLAQGKTAEIGEVLAPVATEGEIGAEAARLTAKMKLMEAARGLGDESAARARLAAVAFDARAKYELGCVLAAAGRYPEALELLLAAAEADSKLATGPVREGMVQIFFILGTDHALANEYRAKLSRLLY
jgi:putative thioredoxin